MVPGGFEADVRGVVDAVCGTGDAAARTLLAGDLDLLANEAGWFSWARDAERLIGEKRAACGGQADRDRDGGGILLFTGHRVDDPDRTARGKKTRFPRSREAEEVAAAAIAASVRRAASERAPVLGIAGGASGGDILFQEACERLRIPMWLYLALPPDLYKDRSVRGAGDAWVARFDRLAQQLQSRTRTLAALRSDAGDPEELPAWLQPLPHYDVWQRCNLWMLHGAFAFGAGRVTLIALWDGEPEGDGPGGTSHLVKAARAAGARVDIIDTKALFGLGH